MHRAFRNFNTLSVYFFSLMFSGSSSDLKPRGVAVSFLPGLPAYIIFMCIRYADHINDEERVSTLLNSTIISIKGVIKVQRSSPVKDDTSLTI